MQPGGAGTWTPVGAVTAAADGSLKVAVRPTVTTQYRLVSGKVTGSAARVAVAPLVRLTTPRTQTEPRGVVRPPGDGAPRLLPRPPGHGWAPGPPPTRDGSRV